MLVLAFIVSLADYCPALASQGTAFSKQDFWQRFDEQKDNPVPVWQWFEEVLQNPTKIHTPEWASAIFFQVSDFRQAATRPSKGNLKRAVEIIRKLEWDDVRILFSYYLDPSSSEHFEDLVNQAREMKDEKLEIHLHLALSGTLIYTDGARSLDAVTHAYNLAKRSSQSRNLEKILTLVKMGLVLEAYGSKKRSLEMFQLSDQDCMEPDFRFICLENIFNHTVAILNQKDPKIAKQSIPYFDRAQQLATEIEYYEVVAMIHLGYSSVYVLLKEYEQAELWAKKAISFFQEINSSIWLADSTVKLASIYQYEKKWEQMIEPLNVALKHYPPEFIKDRIEVFERLHLAQAAMERHQEAYQSSLEMNQLTEKFWLKKVNLI
ncbi:MAG: hypothetical protein HRU19_26475 [Pseudobacteriovorax sp.]|nr:hypothetical protein [Pseudobacteriovorax sp.]